MPIYDYVCPNGHRFEVIHSVSGTGPETCPVCGAAPVRKAISAPSIHFKGSGWAKKDRSAASRPAAAAAGGSSDDGSKSDAGSKTEAATKGDDSGSKKGSTGASDAGADSSAGPSSGSGSSKSPAAD